VPYFITFFDDVTALCLMRTKLSPFNRFREFRAPRVLTSFPTRATVNFSKVAARAVKLIGEKHVSQEVVEK
jgi:hypothetical protein